jgi:tetratricopeptide (TPR) repeat protein
MLTALPLVAVEGLLLLLVGRRLGRFEQTLTDHVRAGQKEALLPLYHAQTLLRFAAPRHVLLAKLGMIHRQLGQTAAAADAYRDALEEAPASKAATLTLGLADCLYDLDEHVEAERLYRVGLDAADHTPAQAHANLARLILRRGGDRREAVARLEAAIEVAHGGKLRLELGHVLLEGEQLEEAIWHLALAGEELAEAPAEQRERLEELRAAVHAAQARRADAAVAEDEESPPPGPSAA